MRTAPDLGTKLKTIESELAEARDERVVLCRDRDRAKAEYVKSSSNDTASRVFKAARAAADAVEDVDSRIADLQVVQNATLKMIGGRDGQRGGPDQNGPTSDSIFAGDNPWRR